MPAPPPAADWAPVRPNILITGTPGVGKTTFATLLAQQLGLRHIDVAAFAKERDALADYDPVHDAHYIHEDLLLDLLEPLMADGAIILDHHSSDWFPERWFQLAVVLSVNTETLYDRLEAREYPPSKLLENVQAEIMNVVYEEAVTCYPKLDVLHLQNDSLQLQQPHLRTVSLAYRALTNPVVEPSVF